jgi:DNA polymerase III subunit chi
LTKVDFYTNVQDKLHTACRITVKAYARGHRITIYCPDPEAALRVDRLLWTTPPAGFVPHCTAEHPLAPSTPVILDSGGEAPLQDDVLLNLSGERPPFFARFGRLIEIVSTEEDDLARARERYRFYRDRGYELKRHELA